MSDKNTKRLIFLIACISLTLIGFHYNSGWAFAGAVFTFFGVID